MLRDYNAVFILERLARKKGGDRYQCSSDADFKIYLPQYISRPNGGKAINEIEITFQPLEKEAS